MEANTVLGGCEILCLPCSDLIACPLPEEEQLSCKQRLQYEAGKQDSDRRWRHILKDAIAVAEIASKQEGRREVVDVLEKEFGEDIADGRSWQIKVPYFKWQAKLKEWGIK